MFMARSITLAATWNVHDHERGILVCTYYRTHLRPIIYVLMTREATACRHGHSEGFERVTSLCQGRT